MKLARPVIGVSTWRLLRPDGPIDDGIIPADAFSAVTTALALLEQRGQ